MAVEKPRRFWNRIGPGLITGVADDDPSGIATYSQAGARFGLDMLWTMALTWPLMSAVQELCGRLGRVTGKGLSANIRTLYSPALLSLLVVLLLIANLFNISADLAAMGEAAQLVTGISHHLLTLGFALLTLGLQLWVPYHRYVALLKWLTASLIAYAAVLFTVHVPWEQVLSHTLRPRFALNGAAMTMIVAIFGTTISPYLFFWQASEEVEDLKGSPSLIDDPERAKAELGRISRDTWSGMLYSNITAFLIMLATALTLNAHGRTHIDTAAQAAEALRPVAGNFAFLLFTTGLIGTGLIAVPVLAGSSAYALAEARGWTFGLERRVKEARGFYAVIALSVLAAVAIQYSPITPMRALFWSAVINGVVAVPLMVVLLLVVGNRRVMGDYVAPRGLRLLGWAATLVMAAAAVAMCVSPFVAGF